MSTPPTPALAVEALSFSLRGKSLLQEISATIELGQRYSIIGGNGAGKSTLLKCLMRIHHGWRGRVTLHGRDLAEYSQRELARRLAYVPQPVEAPNFPYSVREFVRMGRYSYSGPFGTPHAEDGDAIEAAMARAGVLPFASRALENLSGGERQRVFIAAALAQGSEILLLDEPTAFLDYRHQAEIAELLQALSQEEGRTIVTVTHDINTALRSGGGVIALREGKLIWSGSVRELNDQTILTRIFDVPFRFVDDPLSNQQLVIPLASAHYHTSEVKAARSH